MAIWKSKSEWNHTSSLLALITNVNTDLKKHAPVTPEEYHPYIKKAAPKRPLFRVRDLKGLFQPNGRLRRS